MLSDSVSNLTTFVWSSSAHCALGLVLEVLVLIAESPPVSSLRPSHHPTQEIFIKAPDYVVIMIML